jgi:hypothetical protein
MIRPMAWSRPAKARIPGLANAREAADRVRRARNLAVAAVPMLGLRRISPLA